MWQTVAPEEDQGTSSGGSAVSGRQAALTGAPRLQGNALLELDEALCCLGGDVSQIGSAARGAVRHLCSRQTEVSQWQSQVLESIRQVDQEVTAAEEAKLTAESVLQGNQMYARLTGRCLAVGAGLSAVRQDALYGELRKEEQLAADIGELLQKHIRTLVDVLSSLKSIRSQLQADFDHKRDAIELTAQCLTHAGLPSATPPAVPNESERFSYDAWLSRCRELRQAAEERVEDSSASRRRLRLALAFLENTKEQQRRRVDGALRKKINALSRVQNSLRWERQQVSEEICGLTNDLHKVGGQMRGCDARLLQVALRLEILDRRPGLERCLDLPYLSLVKEKRELMESLSGLCSLYERSQRDLQAAQRRLTTVEEKLSHNTRLLEGEENCYNLYQSFRPRLHHREAAAAAAAAAPPGAEGPEARSCPDPSAGSR